MSITTKLALTAALAMGVPSASARAFGGGDGDDYVSNQAVVQLVPGADINSVCDDFDTTLVAVIPQQRLYLLHLPEDFDEEQFEMMVEQDPRVQWADLNFEGEAAGGSTQSFFFNVNPSSYISQLTWSRINLQTVPTQTAGQGIVIALLDTGVAASHPALLGHIAAGGFNFVDNNANVSDVGNGLDDDGDGLIDELTGHGTYLAGILGHVAPAAAILPIKVLDSDGNGNAFTVAQGIFYAIDHGASVMWDPLESTCRHASLSIL